MPLGRTCLFWVLALAVTLLFAPSCARQESLNPVQGKVLYNNEPLAGATVVFLPKARSETASDFPAGETEADGTFVVATGNQTGAAAGDYDVTIVCNEIPAPKAAKSGGFSTGELEPRDRLQGAYANPTKSKLSVQIKDGVNELEPFVLK